MKNMRKIVTTLVLLVTLPLAAQAMQHASGAADMDHSKMDMDHSKMDMDHNKMDMDHGKMDMDHGKMDMDHGKMDHDGMKMDEDMIMVGDSVQDGVKAMVHLKEVKDTMAKMGMKATHHIMVMFVDQVTGQPVESGVAAVKMKRANAKEEEAIKLMGMQGHFGADIELTGPGEYHFMIGTKLADGKKRQFDFDFTLK